MGGTTLENVLPSQIKMKFGIWKLWGLAKVKKDIEAAVKAGSDPADTRITTIMEVPMSYVPGGGCRVQVKAAGPLAPAG